MSEGAADTSAEDVNATGLEIEPAALAKLIESDQAELVDVRRGYEFEAGHIAGSRNVEVNDLTAAADSIPKDRTVVFYCRGGSRSAMAAEAFSQAGYDAHNLAGGLVAWVDQGHQIDPPDGEVAEPRAV